MNSIQQLEFGLDRAQAFHLPARRRERQSRARWWFRQMRAAVNQALDWAPIPPAPPRQAWLPLPARRQAGR